MMPLTELVTVFLPLQTADDGRASEETVDLLCRRWNLSHARKELIRCVYFQKIRPMDWRRLYANPTPGCTSYAVDEITESEYSQAWNDIHRYLGDAILDPQDHAEYFAALDGMLRWNAIEAVARWERQRFGTIDS